MATIVECREALEKLAKQFADKPNPPEIKRTLSCGIPDLDDGFHALLTNGRLDDITAGRDENAQITLTADSDDLVALSNGELSFTKAWASQRVKIDASFMDLLKLRSLL